MSKIQTQTEAPALPDLRMEADDLGIRVKTHNGGDDRFSPAQPSVNTEERKHE